MYAFSLVLFSLVEMLAWYMILLRLHLFPSGHSFFILQLQECFKLTLLFQSSLFINFLLQLSIILSSLKSLFIKP